MVYRISVCVIMNLIIRQAIDGDILKGQIFHYSFKLSPHAGVRIKLPPYQTSQCGINIHSPELSVHRKIPQRVSVTFHRIFILS